jgi:hypothetical protein
MNAENFTRKLTWLESNSSRIHICRDVDGSLISNEQETLERWVRHLKKLLNGSNDNECITFYYQTQ